MEPECVEDGTTVWAAVPVPILPAARWRREREGGGQFPKKYFEIAFDF